MERSPRTYLLTFCCIHAVSSGQDGKCWYLDRPSDYCHCIIGIANLF